MIELEQNELQRGLNDDPSPAFSAEPARHDRLFNTLQGIATLCFLWAAFATLLIGIIAIQTESRNGNRDFIEYWAGSYLLLHGQNAYDMDAALQLERSAGFTNPSVELSPSPPVVFAFTLPLGFFTAPVAANIWTGILTVCLLVSLYGIWITLDRPRGHMFWLGFCFAPVLTCLMAGQIGIILLLSIVLFLQFHRTRPFLAGMALLPCSCKPHLFVPFAIALLLWTLIRSQYRILVGFSAALLASAALASSLDIHVWSQWLQWIHNLDPVNLFQPDLSKMFRLLVRPESIWVQFVPEMLSGIWAGWYFWTRRSSWDWMQQGMVVLIVSIGCAPYAWYTDESILLVPVLAGAYRAHAFGRTLLPCALILAVADTALFKGNWINSSYYLWTIPAYLLWYLYATRQSSGSAYLGPAPEAHA